MRNLFGVILAIFTAPALPVLPTTTSEVSYARNGVATDYVVPASVPDPKVSPTDTGAQPATTADNLAGLHAALDRVQANRRFFAPFTAVTGCQAAPTGSDGEAVSMARSTVGEVVVSGTPSSCAINNARFGDAPRGLIVERDRANYISMPDAPVNQTGRAVGVNSYYLRIEGSGSIAVTLASGVATGLPCTATAASPCSFNVTSAGTIDTAVSGSVTFAQLENGPYPSTRIHGSSRGNDHVSIVNPIAATDDWCVSLTAVPLLGRPWRAGVTRALFGIGENTTAANSAYAAVSSTGAVLFSVRDSGNAERAITCTAYPGAQDDFLGSVPHEFRFCSVRRSSCVGTTGACGVLSVHIDGAAPKCTGGATGVATGLITTMPANIKIGYAPRWSWLDGIVRDVAIVTRESRSATLNANSIATVGSSSTENTHITPASDRYPAKLATKLGAPWTVTNLGASGTLINDMVQRWYAGMRRSDYGVVIALAGMGDYQNGDSADVITAKLKPWFDSIRADGRRLVIVNLLPANDTQAEYDRRLAVNQWLASYCATNAVTCIDGAAAIADPEDPKRILPAFDNGAKHYNNAGAEALATAVRTAFP